MTRRGPVQVEQIARTFPCPTCHARAWVRCHSVTGKPRSASHTARYEAATNAGRLLGAEPTTPIPLET